MESQSEDQRDPHHGLGGGEEDFLDLAAVKLQCRTAAADHVGHGQRADQQRPLEIHAWRDLASKRWSFRRCPFRATHRLTSTTTGQPSPISNRLDPVMFDARHSK